jgi:hypothetical protein
VGFELRTGIPLPTSNLEQIISQLDEALLLDSPTFAAAYAAALEKYRTAPYRPMALAGKMYPPQPEELKRFLESFGRPAESPTPEATPVCGLISPHIDFVRGGSIYAQVWHRAAQALQTAELVIIFGTDHAAAGPTLTPTRQHYATPWGVLPTASEVVEALAQALGPAAFHNELHHRNEHSIEAAAIWLHYLRAGHSCQIVPILCGSFDPLLQGEADASYLDDLKRGIEALRQASKGRRTVVVAAADLAHVGPAFGDPQPWRPPQRESLTKEDQELLATISSGDAESFLRRFQAAGDRYRVCGLPPIYLALTLLQGCRGEVTGYLQCPADSSATSLVSIAGVVLRREALVH